MASIALSSAQTIFAVLAFADSGYLFKMIDKYGYSKEPERHTRATEKLGKAKEKFYENEVKQRNKAEQLRGEMAEGNVDMDVPNKAFVELMTMQYNGRKFSRPSVLQDFYKLQRLRITTYWCWGQRVTLLGIWPGDW